MTDLDVETTGRGDSLQPDAGQKIHKARSAVGNRTHTKRPDIRTYSVQFTIIALILVAWQYLPTIRALRNSSHVFDPFFVSSPSSIFNELVNLSTGRDDTATIWPYVWPTLSASLIGVAIGVLLGAVSGLMLSNSPFWSGVLNPFIVAINAIPRIALIPIIVILVGPTFESSIINSVLVVYFVAFFNAYEGGTSVPSQLLDNALVLKASKWQIIYHIRLRYTIAWTLATLPLAVAFGLLAVVTGEILTGYGGLGELISQATITANATETFAVVVVLSVLGSVIVYIANVVKRRVLHWWGRA
jgi:NitT/TauT family transport system permease protein